jgi:hypothetical protein
VFLAFARQRALQIAVALLGETQLFSRRRERALGLGPFVSQLPLELCDLFSAASAAAQGEIEHTTSRVGRLRSRFDETVFEVPAHLRGGRGIRRGSGQLLLERGARVSVRCSGSVGAGLQIRQPRGRIRQFGGVPALRVCPRGVSRREGPFDVLPCGRLFRKPRGECGFRVRTRQPLPR